ncbi:MAG: hypothetical protein ABMA64_28740 [Myxococcota bacterium]
MQSILDRAVATHPVAARLVDFWHLIEHLGKANAAVRRFSQDLVHDWKADLLERDDAVDQIEAELRTWALDYPDDAIPEGLYNALTYIDTTASGSDTPPCTPPGCPSAAVPWKRPGRPWWRFG